MKRNEKHSQRGPNGQRLCGARTRTGAPCKGWAMKSGRCRMHGGKSYRGRWSPTFKHGLYSRDFLTRDAALYRLAPDLADRMRFHPVREKVRVALVYKNEGREAAYRLLAELTIKGLVRRYGSIEAVEARFFGRLSKSTGRR